MITTTIDKKVKSAKELANNAATEERALTKLERDFALASPQFATFLKKQKEIQTKINEMWAAVKNTLVDQEFTDVIENDNFKISLSKVLNFRVLDVDELPKEYVETIKSPKMDKIKKHFELYETLPQGVADASYYRLNKKIKEA